MRNLKIIYIIEKKPFTLDKDKEDQNKCYLTCFGYEMGKS